MPKVLVSDKNLTNIANAIREKNGETTTYKPSEMATAIQNISSGGSTPTTGFVPTKWCETGNIQEKGLITEGEWYGTQVSEAAFYTSAGPNITYKAPFGMLKKITFVDEVTTIGMAAFYECRSLVLSELPNGVDTILKEAFYDCGSITEMTCQGDVKSMSSKCFYYCWRLSKFVLPNVTATPTLGSNVFKSTPIADGTGYIYVPDTLVDSFKTATNWSTYADQIKPISELEVV